MTNVEAPRDCTRSWRGIRVGGPPSLATSLKCHRPQENFRSGFLRALSRGSSSTRPCIATPRFGPIASTTIAARGSAVRLRNFTPSTSKSSDPSSFIVYMTGTTCGQPEGPTVPMRAIRCERRNSSSAALNTSQILDSTVHMGITASSTIGGYTITRREPLARLEGEYLELEHQRTGAKHIHIQCPDDNNAFAVFFSTPPPDSTGVAHILEHVVLSGSQRFPVRDPFFSMTRRTLATFMNALTGADWTMYLFSTRNARDYKNLLEVYLDATFFPRLDRAVPAHAYRRQDPGRRAGGEAHGRGRALPGVRDRGQLAQGAGADGVGHGAERGLVPLAGDEGPCRGAAVERRLAAAQSAHRLGPRQRAGRRQRAAGRLQGVGLRR